MENAEVNIKQFLNYISQGKLKGVKCGDCGGVIIPPRYKCGCCETSNFKWTDLTGKGKLLTYTVIHVPPKKFVAEAPYLIGIIQLEEGPKVEARITGVDVDKHEGELKIGMDMIFTPSDKGILVFRPLK